MALCYDEFEGTALSSAFFHVCAGLHAGHTFVVLVYALVYAAACKSMCWQNKLADLQGTCWANRCTRPAWRSPNNISQHLKSRYYHPLIAYHHIPSKSTTT